MNKNEDYFSSYLSDLSECISEIISQQNSRIVKKIKKGKKLDELELMFISEQLKIIERSKNK